MQVENITTVFVDYLRLNKSAYAILINGSWGSGKTYFWKNTLEHQAKKLDYKPIYISLNGVNKIDTVEYLLLVKLIPLLNKKDDNTVIKNVTTFVGNIANTASKAFLKSSFNELLKGVSLDFLDYSKYVICFDDLERCQVPISEVLGFINNYVEHRGAKTIILADEKNIRVDSKVVYNNIKEKVIGRIFNFELDSKAVLPNLFLQYQQSNKEFYDFLIANENFIVDLLSSYRLVNLRVIQFYLDSLEKIHSAINQSEPEDVNIILAFTAAIIIEFKNGRLGDLKYQEYNGLNKIDKNLQALRRFRITKDNNQEDIEGILPLSYADEFYDTYYDDYSREYVFYKSIIDYVLSGYLDLKLLKNEISEKKITKDSIETIEYNKIVSYKFRELEDDEFANMVQRVIEYAMNGKYSIYQYASIANVYYFFSEKELISTSVEKIEKFILDGLYKAAERNEIDEYTLENLLHFGDENPKVTDVKKQIAKIHEEIKKKNRSNENDELVNSILKKDIDSMLTVFKKHIVSHELFIYTDPILLYDAIIKTSNRQLEILERQIKNRYNSTNIGEFLSDDIPLLEQLNYHLSKHFTSSTIGQPKKFLLQEFINRIKEVIRHLKATKK